MNLDKFMEQFGIRNHEHNCLGLLRQMLRTGEKYYIYTYGKEFTQTGNVRQPPLYTFDGDDLRKNTNSGIGPDYLFGKLSRHVGTYNFFKTKEEAMEWAGKEKIIRGDSKQREEKWLRETKINNLVPTFITNLKDLCLTDFELQKIETEVILEMGELYKNKKN